MVNVSTLEIFLLLLGISGVKNKKTNLFGWMKNFIYLCIINLNSMMDSISDCIYKFSEQAAPSGFEAGVINAWKESIRQYVDSVRTSSLGNGVAIINGDEATSIMIVAHADEIGFIITRVDLDKKIAYFDEIGGIDTKLLPGRIVEFTNVKGEKVAGVIGCQPIHCQSRFESSESLRLEAKDLWIDFGDNIEKIALGDYGVISQSCVRCGNLISGRAMDNKSGLSVLVELASMLKDFPVRPRPKIYLVASTMEEIGARGVRTVVNDISPYMCVVVDVALATDTLYHNKANSSPIVLGGGPVITVGPNLDKEMTSKLQSIAKQQSLSYQVDVIGHPTGTDANPIQIMQSGIRCALVGIPCRYMHTPVETINVCDIKVATEIIYKYLLTI